MRLALCREKSCVGRSSWAEAVCWGDAEAFDSITDLDSLLSVLLVWSGLDIYTIKGLACLVLIVVPLCAHLTSHLSCLPGLGLFTPASFAFHMHLLDCFSSFPIPYLSAPGTSTVALEMNSYDMPGEACVTSPSTLRYTTFPTFQHSYRSWKGVFPVPRKGLGRFR